ncbi:MULTISPECIES: UbiX family flavin prenyltransferase [Rhodococcus]|uniref:Flavin prenyltransferase UbiX n=1 Tax=Rhodococcus globerulus TaxID=33008 RepID=A0ABU4BYJ2_RHOGO|nr:MULTISPECIES: UbiX family flavin prenyltransferase [Rhodococcus]MDV6269307.1 UbiX family flavin prenyltransferase [Rhodococcus globerulus]MDV8066656.1 UbiX family flavin prenyltransferase [Rhodococcus sp. IEGM 1366]
MNSPPRIVVGISGASGAVLGIRALEVLREHGIETHLVISKSGRATIAQETDYSIADVTSLATKSYSDNDVGAAISSGSFRIDGMLVAPCSVKTLSGIANSYDENLLVRAADVTMKERRRLVLLLRETPLHAGHIRLMAQATESGAIVMPPMPAFYTRPQTVQDIIDHCVYRALDLLGVHVEKIERWSGWKSFDHRDPMLPRLGG